MDFQSIKSLNRKRSGKTAIKPWMVIVFVIALILIFTPWGGFVVNKIPTPPTVTPPSPSPGVSTTSNALLQVVNKKIAFSAIDFMGGSAVASGTYKIYTAGGVLVESLSAAADSTVTSTQTYQSGTLLNAVLSVASYETQYAPFVVPYMSPADAQASSTNNYRFYWAKLGAWSPTLTMSGNSVFSTSGGSYYFSGAGGVGAGNTVTIALSEAETTTNAGYVGCNPVTKVGYDFQNNLCRHLILEVSDTTATPLLSITGVPLLTKIGNSLYYDWIMPDGVAIGGVNGAAQSSTPQAAGVPMNDQGSQGTSGSSTYQTIGNIVYGGTESQNFQVNPGSLAAGSCENVSVKVWAYGDLPYFVTYNIYGPNAVQQGSTFTQTFCA